VCVRCANIIIKLNQNAGRKLIQTRSIDPHRRIIGTLLQLNGVFVLFPGFRENACGSVLIYDVLNTGASFVLSVCVYVGE
jgi:hypothetical protein